MKSESAGSPAQALLEVPTAASERPLSFAEVLEKALTDYIERENPSLAEQLKRS